ncbi:TPA: helix-turn-helix transcriptional regulator [Clostridioides difficile]|uniref:helix-turn-helix domain-containing protein n=1 Tax=Clostridioides difficile TaxID=1496 RepID=UPI00017F4C9E|nr:helix-turn-helix transcriptional regulator [Clostridioides difficile]EGT2203336.1 helix-turn-helix domain-containing protein [Clostridioides difficile]EGT4668733.1 XRE family transcriptional regulator [Clostridioides difficile]MBJ9768841.1 helix-turn-helix transcriptional regulator [Clostridioides difficile]MCI9916171.1 helix-turn-helix transcriptional regulator [Clostridioides difficile]MDN9318627.1 helix-turn-helix domain-containing protein [Clostridioides difficile]
MNELNIAKTLILKRKEKGITQDELANYIGVSKASVSKWETGQSYPDITFLPQLATYFNITVDELICYEPQMMKEDINKLYNKLCKDFTAKPFDEVMIEIREIIKRYYSCFPLIFRMGLLIVNHYDIVDEKKRELLIDEALEIFIRIQETCNDIDICRQAKNMEATCYILLNQPIQVIDLLQNSNFPMINESILLAQGQMMNGQIDEARETFQLGAYQNLISLVQNLVGILQNADKLQMKEIERRILAISNIFELDTLSPATMLSAYLTQTQINLIHEDNEGAIKSLRKYVDLATSDIYPITIHGDDFFDKLDRWISEIGIGITRDDTIVKAGIVAAIKNNPMFSVLSENKEYKFLIEKLSLLEE